MSKSTAEQRRLWNKRYYEKNKITRRAQYNKWRKELVQWFKIYKSTLICERCGFDHPAAIQFHHRDASLKRLDVSNMVRQGYGKDTIKDEIAKCEIICANCHAIEHWSA